MRYFFLAFLALLCNVQLLAQAAKKKSTMSVLTYKTFADQKATYGFHKAATKTYKIKRLPPDSISYGEPQEFLEKAAAPCGHWRGAFLQRRGEVLGQYFCRR